MKTVYILVSLFYLQLNPLYAQTADKVTPTWGLQYQIGSDFTLYSFSGTSLSLI